MLNQGLLEDQAEMSSQMFYFNSLSLPFGCNQILQQAPFAESPKPKDDHFGGTQQLLSIQRSSHINLWAWGEDSDCIISSSAKRRISGVEDHKNNNIGISATTMKKIKSTRRKVREPRFCFKTLSDVDVLDDGYKWRKYGQKVVKNTQHPRSYYRCTQDNCRVKKRVERLAEDPRMVITTYEGRHAHSPSQDEENDTSSQLNHFFW